MSDELKFVRGFELEAWERYAQQYQYAYAFIRLSEAGQEREWINSFGELALERDAEHKTIFVFFSDLEISIVRKILGQNLRIMSKEKAALEALIGAWFQYSDEKLKHLALGPEALSDTVESVLVEKGLIETDLLNSICVGDSVDYRALYEKSLNQLSLALTYVAVQSETAEAAENVFECIRAITSVAAQQGFLKLYLYLQSMQSMASESLIEDKRFDFNGIDSLRDCLTYIKALVATVFSESDEIHFSRGLQLPFLSDLTSHRRDELHLSSPELQQVLQGPLAKLTGYLRIDALNLEAFEKEIAFAERGDDLVRRYGIALSRLARHANELQALVTDVCSVSIKSLLEDSASNAIFSRSSVLLPLCCEFEGDVVRIPSSAVQQIQKCFDFLHQFLNRLPDSFSFAHLCVEPLKISLRQSAVEQSVLIAHSNQSEHWQMFARLLKEHLKLDPGSSRFIAKEQLSSGLLLKFPVELATSQNLLVESAGERIALFAGTLLETGRVDSHMVQKVGSKRFVPFREGVIPLVSLSQALSFDHMKVTDESRVASEHENPVSSPKRLEFVIAKVSNDVIAFEVDEILGQRELVVRDLNKIVPRFSGFLGVSVLEDERVSLVVDVAQLMTSEELNRGEHARQVS